MTPKVIINQGLPGSGKSKYVQEIVRKSPPNIVYVCSADTHHTMDDGTYNYKPEEAGTAHRKCMQSFMKCAQDRVPIIFVDNTNIYKYEMSPYVAVAKVYGYDVQIERFQCSVETALRRNTHDVPEATIEAMYRSMEMPLQRWGKFEITITESLVMGG